MTLDPKLIQFIDFKAAEECGATNLLLTSVYISQLSGYINGFM